MKVIVTILLFTAAVAAVAATFGVSHARYASGRWEIERTSPPHRAAMAVLSASCLVVAVGCLKKSKASWWAIALIWAVLTLGSIVTGILSATESKFAAAFVDVAIGGLMIRYLLMYWMPMRPEFSSDSKTRQQEGISKREP